MEDRIIELETRVAYQEKLLSDLDEVVQAFAKRVEVLEKRLQTLRDAQLEHPGEMEPHNTPPPHY
ncbi:MAG: SlyX family protein [Acidobacteriota bacterium]